MATTTVATVKTTLTATPQQTTFLAALTQTDSHLCLQARAGCGKTTAILMGVEAYHTAFPQSEQLVCAYNKAIADEVVGKLKARGYDWQKVQAATLHSLGFGLVRYIFKPTVDDKKVKLLVNAHTERNLATNETDKNRHVYLQYSAQITALVGYAKQAGVGFFDDMPIGDAAVWYRLADHYDVNGFDDTSAMDTVVAAAQQIYRESLDQTSVIDYDDMILFPLVKNLRVKFTKDIIYLDEAQDLSRARQALARKFIKPRTGRMVVVGDDRQAIYGFSGADAAALSNLTSELGAMILPLSVTWRCPKSVVALANRIVPDLEAALEAPEGEVLYLDSLPEDLKPGDAILCRNTAPLIQIAYRLIRSGRACKVEGRKIGEGLAVLAQRWKVGSTDMLRKRLEDYCEREMQKALAKGDEAKAESVRDRVDTLYEVIVAVNSRQQFEVSDVLRFISDLFADGADNVIVCATYHRSKGREWSRVILWEHSKRCPSKAAKQSWQKEQEMNLAYVAITRSKSVLVFVTPPEEK